MPLVSKENFTAAVRNVARWGDTDVFPFPFENHILHDREVDVVNLLMAFGKEFDKQIEARTPINHSALSPVGYNGYRWVTQIDPLWNAYLLGLVVKLAPQIERARVPRTEEVVFSYRWDPSGDERLFAESGWTDFQARSRALAEDGATEFVVLVDIADFYARIYHHRIENELKYIDKDGGAARQIVKILDQFSKGVSYGLPVGGPAARVLAELLLNATDRLLLTSFGAIFTRYADDFRFFVPDRETAYKCIGFLSELLQRNEGLSLQRSKTRIFTKAEFLATLQTEDPRPGSAAKFLGLHVHYDPYSPTAEEDYEELKQKLEEFDIVALLRTELAKGRLDAALARRLVSVLKHLPALPRKQALLSLLDNVEILAPIMPQVLRAIRDSLNGLSPDSQEQVQARLRWLIETRHHTTQANVNLAFLVRALAATPCRENELLLAKLFDEIPYYVNAPAPNIQRDIMLTLAKWDATYFLHNVKSNFSTMHDWVRRAFFVSSYALGDEGRHWRDSVRQQLDDFEKIVATWSSEKVQIVGWEIPI